MKKLLCMFLAVVLIGVAAKSSIGAPVSEALGKKPDIPGSAALWPTIKEESLPPKPGKRGQVKLGIWIREDGSVDGAEFLDGQKNWKDECLDAAKKIKFEPVMWEGKAIPARTQLTYTYDRGVVSYGMSPLPNLPGEIHADDEWGLTKGSIELDPDLILPLMLQSRSMLSIEAAIQYVITEEGTTDKIQLLGASSEGAVRSALDLMAERKYRPAKVREQPVRTEFKQVISFQSLGKPIPALAGAVDIVDPAYPYDRLLAGEEGFAVVKFTLTSEGKVESTVLLEASHPDFGGALVAAVESWYFKADAAGESGAVREYRHDFLLSGVPYAARRLITDARAGEVVSSSSAGLDAKPKILARPGLAYPTALYAEQVSGSAEVEFIIDRVGLAQLPRVLKATKPEFGWAAVTLVNGMRFTPMTRGGKPAELRIRMPVNFAPPKPDAPAAAGG